MYICCYCIVMQLLTHYDHVIVQSLIVHPVCNATRLVAAEVVFLFFFFYSKRGGFYPGRTGFLGETRSMSSCLCANQRPSLCCTRGWERGLAGCLSFMTHWRSELLCVSFFAIHSPPALMFHRYECAVHSVFFTSCYTER